MVFWTLWDQVSYFFLPQKLVSNLVLWMLYEVDSADASYMLHELKLRLPYFLSLAGSNCFIKCLSAVKTRSQHGPNSPPYKLAWGQGADHYYLYLSILSLKYYHKFSSYVIKSSKMLWRLVSPSCREIIRYNLIDTTDGCKNWNLCYPPCWLKSYDPHVWHPWGQALTVDPFTLLLLLNSLAHLAHYFLLPLELASMIHQESPYPSSDCLALIGTSPMSWCSLSGGVEGCLLQSPERPRVHWKGRLFPGKKRYRKVCFCTAVSPAYCKSQSCCWSSCNIICVLHSLSFLGLG